MKRSDITNLAAKIRVPEVVAMETVTHSLFSNGRYISRGSSYCPETLFFEFGPSEFKVDKATGLKHEIEFLSKIGK